MSRERVNKEGLNSLSLCSLLKRVNMKGTIEECVLTIEKGIGYVQAVDMSNSIFVSCQEALGKIEDTVLGLPKISLLTQFLEGDEEVTFAIDNKEKECVWLTLKKVGRGQIKTLLTDPKLVPTVVQGNSKEIENNMLGLVTISFLPTQKSIEDLISYIAMIGCASVTFKLVDGIVWACNNPNDPQQFNLRLSLTTVESPDFSVEVYSQYLIAVFKAVVWLNHTPTISIGNNAPVIIKQNKNNLWALTPIMAN